MGRSASRWWEATNCCTVMSVRERACARTRLCVQQSATPLQENDRTAASPHEYRVGEKQPAPLRADTGDGCPRANEPARGEDSSSRPNAPPPEPSSPSEPEGCRRDGLTFPASPSLSLPLSPVRKTLSRIIIIIKEKGSARRAA